jgi:hypothetical protein
MRLRVGLLLVLGLLVVPSRSLAQKAADPDLAEGIRLVETGEYDTAILTLDNAARRLASDPSRVSELSRAYLYLGIAYMGKGHEAAARAKFREAVLKVRTLTLSPEEFPPKVIDAFEEARAEAMKTAGAPAAPSTPPAEAPKKGGSKVLLIVGGVAVAGGVAALAAGGGGGGGASSSTSAQTTTQPTTPAVAPTTTDDLSGFLPPGEGSRHFPVRVQAAGTLVANLSWAAPAGQPVELVMQLFDGAGRDVALSNRTAPAAAVLSSPVTPQPYDLSVFYASECPGCEAQFHLLVTHP